jgi:hypothetical protein
MLAFTNLPGLAADVFKGNGLVIKGNHKTVRGIETVGVTVSGGSGDTIYVALSGDPYPLRVVPRGGSLDYALNFVDFGKPWWWRCPRRAQVVDELRPSG